MFAVGVGTNVGETELTAIASTPKSNHVYYLASFRDITSFAKQVLPSACKGNTETAHHSGNYYFPLFVINSDNIESVFHRKIRYINVTLFRIFVRHNLMGTTHGTPAYVV